MNLKKFTAALMALMVFLVQTPVLASETDLSKTGTITITLPESFPEISAEVSIYQAALTVQDSEKEVFESKPGFEQFETSFADLDTLSSQQLQELCETIDSKLDKSSVQPVKTITVTKEESGTLSDIPCGLYFVTVECSSNAEIAPFLVSIPCDGQYEVEANTKWTITGLVKPVTPEEIVTAQETVTPEETAAAKETTESSPKTMIPDTSSPYLRIILLAAAGVILIFAGALVYQRKTYA